MKYIKGYRFRLYPNKIQQQQIKRTLGCCRFVFNHFLRLHEETYACDKKYLSYYKSTAMLTQLKKDSEYSWLKEADSQALNQALRDLDKAYQNFFKGSGYPKFKSRRQHTQSYRTSGAKTRIEGKRIVLPKLGAVKFKQSREIHGRILSSTVTLTASGKYFVSLCVEENLSDNMKRNGGGEIGIDVGIKFFYTDNHGNTVANPRILSRLTRKLIKEQRRLSRRKSGSSNYNKQRRILARVHERIANARRDFLHKQSTKLCRENQFIAIESLRIKNMVRNHSLAKAITDASWGEFFRQLEYKSVMYGCDLCEVPHLYPSSQICSNCGCKNPLVKNLKVRDWICPSCGAYNSRDENAARNIFIKGREMIL